MHSTTILRGNALKSYVQVLNSLNLVNSALMKSNIYCRIISKVWFIKYFCYL